ncbi:MAG: saccharopine dehydrogenase NADP-binding domain-containing protein [Immundisolibacteraceae bacterium]|nr:saccharopine dehydrogenase NADP-binding domain-containing protein [Immundisolibacteraceae bacterium]
MKKTLILGGYGNFGRRIAADLGRLESCLIYIAGRNLNRAQQCCDQLNLSGLKANYQPVALDINRPELTRQLTQLELDLCIHTSGPFQGQDHRVAKACIEAGSHYLDLADDRRFVCDINQLDDAAIRGGVVVVSGVSTVPGLSSVVIDRLLAQFSTLDKIDYSILPANQAEIGDATLRGVLSYAGQPFTTFRSGRYSQTFGWANLRTKHFGETLGQRWLADLDIPDLELFPQRYPELKNLSFQAGQELPLLHLTLYGFAQLRRLSLLPNLAGLTPLFQRIAACFKSFGSDLGGMSIALSGKDLDGKPTKVTWTLIAPDGIGPQIPTLPAIILARRIINQALTTPGAQPCLGLFSLEEFDQLAGPMGIYHQTEVTGG